MKNVLVPLSAFSPAQNIIRYTESVSRKSGAGITLLFCCGRRMLYRAGEIRATEGIEQIDALIRDGKLRAYGRELYEKFAANGMNFSMKFVVGSTQYATTREATAGSYDMLIMGIQQKSGWSGYFQLRQLARTMQDLSIPALFIPEQAAYNEIRDVAFAVDLASYDPNIIQQVKTIAALFDAKLTVVHVNQPVEEKSEYRQRLEQTISDTLDYPKVNYRFFDHADPFGGIMKFVSQNNSQMLALTNRTRFSLSSFFGGKSISQKIAQNLRVPFLTFSAL